MLSDGVLSTSYMRTRTMFSHIVALSCRTFDVVARFTELTPRRSFTHRTIIQHIAYRTQDTLSTHGDSWISMSRSSCLLTNGDTAQGGHPRAMSTTPDTSQQATEEARRENDIWDKCQERKMQDAQWRHRDLRPGRSCKCQFRHPERREDVRYA